MYIHCRYKGVNVRRQVQKWGNSLALRIPKAYAAQLGVTSDSSVELSVKEGCLMMRPAVAPRYELRELLASVTPDNLHSEVDFGPQVGREVW